MVLHQSGRQCSLHQSASSDVHAIGLEAAGAPPSCQWADLVLPQPCPGADALWLVQFTSPQLQAALAAAGASAGSQPGGPPGGPAPKSALAALAAGGPDTRIDLSSLSFPFAPSRRATAEVEAERLDLGKLAFPFRGGGGLAGQLAASTHADGERYQPASSQA